MSKVGKKLNKRVSELTVKVIGGAGAFSNSNASFLIELNDRKKSNILFDCSENTFQYIKRNNLDIDLVFISHTHADHINGLEKLVFYNYFIKNKRTIILTGEKVNIENYLPKQSVYENGMLVDVDMYKVFHSFEEMIKFPSSLIPELADDKINWADISNQRFIFKGNHIVLPSYGLLIRIGLNALIITGDTKASPMIRDLIKTELNIGIENIHVFHDFQTFGASINSVHCCQDDFDFYYKEIEDSRVKWYLYHNDDFDNENIMKTIKIK